MSAERPPLRRCRFLAAASLLSVFYATNAASVDYRLEPEHPRIGQPITLVATGRYVFSCTTVPPGPGRIERVEGDLIVELWPAEFCYGGRLDPLPQARYDLGVMSPELRSVIVYEMSLVPFQGRIEPPVLAKGVGPGLPPRPVPMESIWAWGVLVLAVAVFGALRAKMPMVSRG